MRLILLGNEILSLEHDTPNEFCLISFVINSRCRYSILELH